MEKTRHFLSLLSFLTFIYGSYCYPNFKAECPSLFQKSFRGYVPRGNLSAGVYEEIPGINQMRPCVLKCCRKDACNVAFMTDDKCYHIACASNELCVPTLNLNPATVSHVTMVLVRPTDDDTWQNVLASQEYSPNEDKDIDREMYGLLSDRSRFEDTYKSLEKDLLVDQSVNYDNVIVACEADSGCLENEICVPERDRPRTGICQCKPGFRRRSDNGQCYTLSELRAVTLQAITEKILNASEDNSAPVTRKFLSVVADSKIVKLPESEATLVADVSPLEDERDKYQFEWTSLHQPDGSTAVKYQNEGQLHLEKLSEGTYEFKVSASTPTAYGETFVNVTVLPATRINKPPAVIITPANQTIKQPNAAAVLDASSSTDDDAIVAWHWELQQGPLGYQPQLKDSSTLQLNDLTKPGNYTFKLTITDSDKATSSGTANITVLAGTDYPPEANAGEDKIIHLPHNSIMLNGSLSTDDHAITTWEWTKSADDAQKAVDMQNTRTPYLQLSDLEEGMYTFVLKVTDSANQSTTAEVHVFVKPATNKPPVADAGQNLTISLPQTWVVLDASNSTDDNQIMSFKWEQIEGPSTVQFDNISDSKTNVTGLTKGVYTFKVEVTDDSKNEASDKVYVIVNQNKNQKPTANAGEDFTAELPLNALILNGSNSKDDWAIVKWRWVRDERSLAMGNIVETTDEKSVLYLTDVEAGTYVFNLTVFDEQGLSDTDTVTVVVKNDPKLYYLVEMTIDVEARLLTEARYDKLKGKLALLVTDGSRLQVRSVAPAPSTGSALLTFLVETTDGVAVAANDVVARLRQKLRVDASLLGFTIARLRTVVCQNDCSGHGACDEATRRCDCEAFWTRDLFRAYLGADDADSDCGWSVLYVVLGAVCGASALVGSVWALVCLCCGWCGRRGGNGKPANYKLISETEDLPPFARSGKGIISDSDTDSDVVFETRSKPPRFSDSRNGHKSSRNGFSKLGRRIKT